MKSSKYHIFFLIPVAFLFRALSLSGQAYITFQLDIKDLIERGLFSWAAGDRVYIRGSFNSWQGTDFALGTSETPGLLHGTFAIGKIGDTLSYKYVIGKDENRFFWENNPNPENQDNGNRLLIIDKKTIVLPPARFHHDEYFSYPVIFPKEKLQDDYRQFRSILASTHPALYDYTSKNELDSLFDRNYEKIDTSLTFSRFLSLMTEVISKVGCGHTSLWVPGKFWNVAPDHLFPLQLINAGNKTWIFGGYRDDPEIPPGSEVLTINKHPIQEIMDRLKALTSADGFNTSYKEEKAAQNFSIKFAFAYGFQEYFDIEFIPPKTQLKTRITLKGISKATIDKAKPDHSELSFRQLKRENTAILTLNTFAYYSKVDWFQHFIDSVFLEIDRSGIENLILDLRGNSGGDPFCASYLWRYLEPEPLPYFLDHYGKYDSLAYPLPLADQSFSGDLYTIIDGNGFSTTGHFCGLLKYHKVGTFIGSELGSTYTCTGNATYPPLPNTGIMVGTARVRRYTTAVQGMDPTRGIIPDYPVELTQQDIIDGRDAVMDFTRSLIKSKQ